ncbi:hypothetical protein [Oceanirhabdus sp. W0125-5]|uniref:hypothetical protein n=1 Tax=Oceanirhabdus sp. W0125-5 TaxID=2999116 RepID=UPI0022F2D62C|nr:hypothetical protein [Oceanirhabdus sp. W0125-5]WBW98373.1 hypothetical protein OW730_06285 [Oceanirhabdus sp. W0125-5]
MPEYSQIQTYIKYNEQTFNEVLIKAGDLFLEFGINKKLLDNWIKDISWKVEDNGFVYTWCDFETQKIKILNTDIDLQIRPLISGFLSQEFYDVVKVELLFHTDEIEDYRTNKLTKEIGQIIWKSLNKFWDYFKEAGVYFTDEAQDCKALDAIHSNNIEELYQFDLAIIPNKFEYLYKNISTEFTCKRISDALVIARTCRWETLPWDANY